MLDVKRCVLLLSLLIAPVVFAQEAEPKPDVVVNVVTDRPDALYKVNEQATFLISVSEKGEPLTEGEADVKLTLAFGKLIEQKTITLQKDLVKVSGTLAEPGFLQCQVTVFRNMKQVKGLAGAAFDPAGIKPVCKLPDDFDEFWQAGRKEAAAIPLDMKITPMPQFSDELQDTFYIDYANVGDSRMYGFLCVPKGKKGPFPAMLFPPSGGLIKPTKPTNPKYAQRGILYLEMGIHDFDPLHPPEGIEKRGGLFYETVGAPDREKYYFRRAILGLDRAIDYLASRPDFDGKHLVINSGSQGGGLALILARLNPRVSAISITKPAMCDLQSCLADRGNTWPPLVRPELQRTGEWVKMSEYFDAANFARGINVPVLANVGFIDSTCPPSSCYAAFNVIPSKNKIMVNLITQGHFWTINDEANAWWRYQSKWLDAQLGLGPEAGPPDKDKWTP